MSKARDELKALLDEATIQANIYQRLAVRLQARLNQFSAENEISPALDLFARDINPEVDQDSLINAMGQKDLYDWSSADSLQSGLWKQALKVAKRLNPAKGPNKITVCEVPIPINVAETRGDMISSTISTGLKTLRGLGFRAHSETITSRDYVTYRLFAYVEDVNVDSFLLDTAILENARSVAANNPEIVADQMREMGLDPDDFGLDGRTSLDEGLEELMESLDDDDDDDLYGEFFDDPLFGDGDDGKD